VDEGTTWQSLPTDAFVEILLCLPQSWQRLVCLVCQHWRAVIDERTLPQSKPVLELISAELAQRPTRALIHALIEGVHPNIWLVGPRRTAL
jgi:hypothetical protein